MSGRKKAASPDSLIATSELRKHKKHDCPRSRGIQVLRAIIPAGNENVDVYNCDADAINIVDHPRISDRFPMPAAAPDPIIANVRPLMAAPAPNTALTSSAWDQFPQSSLLQSPEKRISTAIQQEC